MKEGGTAITSEWVSYRRLLRYARPYVWRLVAGALCGVLFAGSTFGSLPALKHLVGRIFHLETTSLQVVLVFSLVLILLTVIRGIGSYLNEYLLQWVGNRVVMDLRIETFTHLQNLSVAYFDRGKTGEMISRTVNDTTLLERAVSTVLTDLARQPLMLIGAGGYLFWVDWKLALASTVLLPVCLWPILLFGRKVRRAAREGQERLADIVGIMQETIGGVRIVRAFCMEEHELGRFAEQCRTFFRRIMRVVKARASLEPIIFLVGAAGVIAALAYANATGMPFEDFFTFGLALVILYEPLKKLSRLHLAVQQCSASADRIFEILDTESTVKERPAAVAFDEPVSGITFEHVAFAYDRTPVLNDIHFSVRAGERVALVGGSGAGKTTLVNLLPRFFDVSAGRILINQTDIRDMTLRSLRTRIGLVTQETFLFNDTVANNIRYGSSRADPAAVVAAAARAHAHDFIRRFPEGYETVVGERGVRLSGGQRQRLAIARAILENPPILILDEATSALDTESERMVQAALEELIEGRTVFAIAHRLSTITNCDRILVMADGSIVQQGSHEQLLAEGGVYRRLYELQFGEEGRGTRGVVIGNR